MDFYADWRGPCQMIAPVVAEIAHERSESTVAKVNVDDRMDLAYPYKTMTIPTLIIFKDSKEHARIVGIHSKQEFLNQLA